MTQMDTALPTAPSPRRVLVIHNPTAGRNRLKRLALVMDQLRALGCQVTSRETTRRGDAEEFARQADPAQIDLVAAAGGDGTVNEVVNGLVRGPGGVSVGVIPLGTANVLAAEICLNPKDIGAVAATLAFGPTRTVHLGQANGRHFVLMAGAGLDAHVVEGVNIALKRRTGKLAYVVESIRQAFGYDFPQLTIRANGQVYECHMAVACKGRYYGGPFIAAPDARLDRPTLEICILPGKGVTGMMRYGLALPLNKLPHLPEITMISTDRATILGPRGAPLQGDGDILARLPVELRIAHETVDLAVPGEGQT